LCWQGVAVHLTRALAAPVLAAAVGALAACGGTAETAAPAAPPQPPAAATAPDGSEGGDCPLDADDLATATGLTWSLGRSIAGHPLETVDGVTADVCVFTSADRPQMAGDPLVLRVDVVEGPDAARMRDEFRRVCTGAGTVEDVTSVAGGARCSRGGQAVEGQVADGDRTVDVYLVNASATTAAELSPSFDKVLAAAAE
jgi:hypothetical protein